MKGDERIRTAVPAPSDDAVYEPDWFRVAIWAGNRTVTECSGFITRMTLALETKPRAAS